MSLIFDTNKRKISLGGKSKATESREEFLRKSQAERERRAQERKELKSAKHIQAQWRSRKAVIDEKNVQRAQWIEHFGCFGEGLAGIQNAEPLKQALLSLLYFYSLDDFFDTWRLAAVLRVVFIKGPNPGASYSELLSSGIEPDRLVLRLSRTLTCGIKGLKAHQAKIWSNPADSQSETYTSCGETLLAALTKLTVMEFWSGHHPNGALYQDKLIGKLAQNGIFEDLAALLMSSVRQLEDAPVGGPQNARGGVASTSVPSTTPAMPVEAPASGYMQDIAGATAVLFQRYAAARDKALSSLPKARLAQLLHILCVPFVFARYPSLKAVALEVIYQAGLDMDDSEPTLDWLGYLPEVGLNGRKGAAAALLGNIAEALSLGRSVQPVWASSPSKNRIAVSLGKIATLAARLISCVTFLQEKHDKDDLGDRFIIDDSPEGGSTDAPVADQWEEDAALPQESVLRQIKMIASTASIHRLADALLVKPQPYLKADHTAYVWAFCTLLKCCLVRTHLSTEAQVALAISPKVVKLIWHDYLKDRVSANSFDPPERNPAGDPGWMLPADILCCGMSSFLAISPETVFYEQQQPISFADLWSSDGRAGLLSLLTTCLWQILWVDEVRHKPLASDSAKELHASLALHVGRLLGQLHARNSRRQYISREAFSAGAAQYAANFLQKVHSAMIAGRSFAQPGGALHDPIWRLLRHAPYIVPFETRVQVFNMIADFEKAPRHWQPTAITIRRSQIFWDAFRGISQLQPQQLKDGFRVAWTDVHGIPEAGIDGGGLFKDFMENLVKEAFDPQLGLFIATSDNRLFPNPNAGVAMDDALPALEFLGKVVGLMMYEGVIVELPLAPFFLKQLLRRGSDVNDLATLDSELYRNLMFLRSYEDDVEALALTFVVSQSVYGANSEVELVPNGRNQPVTNANRTNYILLTANYRLNVETRAVTHAFMRGLESIIPVERLQMFNEEELQMLIRGVKTSGIDVSELQSNVEYGNGYTREHPTIKAFWEALASFTPEQQNKWLKFVTACSRPPLLGFRDLHPKLCIVKAGSDNDSEAQKRLPTSATCMNMLKLPPITSAEQISKQMLFAIDHAQGFDLS